MTRPAPAPFVLGAARSGTTLLRLALDAQPTFGDLGLTASALRETLRRVPAWTLADGLRAVSRAYAARRGQPRWGDKRPASLRRTLEPIDASGVGRWREVLGRDEAAAVESGAGRLLRELGYAA